MFLTSVCRIMSIIYPRNVFAQDIQTRLTAIFNLSFLYIQVLGHFCNNPQLYNSWFVQLLLFLHTFFFRVSSDFQGWQTSFHISCTEIFDPDTSFLCVYPKHFHGEIVNCICHKCILHHISPGNVFSGRAFSGIHMFLPQIGTPYKEKLSLCELCQYAF